MDSVEVARSFVAEIRERAADIESAGRMPSDLARRMSATGLFRILVPAKYGGLQVHPRMFFETLETTAHADASVGWCLMIGTTTGLLSASFAEDRAHEVYGSRPDVITCGVTAPIGRAERVEGGVRVSGRWPFASASQVSDWIGGGCLLIEDGEPVIGDRGPRALLPLFAAEEVTIHDTWHTSGLCGTGSHDIEVNDVFVPEGRWSWLGEAPRIDDTLYRFPTLGLLALGVSAVSLGTAQRAIDAFAELAVEKTPSGSRRTLSEWSGAQAALARAIAAVKSARAYSLQAIDEAWAQAEGTGRLDLRTKADLRLAATHNAWAAVDAVDRLYHAAGGSSIYRSNVLQRCFRDVHVATQHIMVTERTLEAVGRVALGIDPKTPL
jgi:alkylation response protein AidB-like acyl-CoA dehydrogenase